jgi:hypothetical protein
MRPAATRIEMARPCQKLKKMMPCSERVSSVWRCERHAALTLMQRNLDVTRNGARSSDRQAQNMPRQ